MGYDIGEIMNYRTQARAVADRGRYGDTEILHVNPIEIDMLKRAGVPLTVNPDTGQHEAFLPLLLGLGGSAMAGTLGISSALAGAIGSGLGSLIETGDLGQGILSGLMGYGIGSLGSELGLFGKEAAKAGEAAATSAWTPNPADVAAGVNVPPISQAADPSFLDKATNWISENPWKAAGLGGIGALGLAGMASGPDTPDIPKSKSNYQRMRMDRQIFNPMPDPTGVEQLYFSPPSFTPYAEGGMVQDEDRKLVLMAVAALRGQHPEPEQVLQAFVERFGEEALTRLNQELKKEGQIGGPGDGQSDTIQTTVDGQDPALLSRDEFVVPADVVSGIGNGSSNAGAQRLYEMIERVRQARTGNPQQPPALDARGVVPA